MKDFTNGHCVYTIETTIWNKDLRATVSIWQTNNVYEYNEFSKQNEDNCKKAMKNKEIRDYRITRTVHWNRTPWKRT